MHRRRLHQRTFLHGSVVAAAWDFDRLQNRVLDALLQKAPDIKFVIVGGARCWEKRLIERTKFDHANALADLNAV